MRFTTTARLTKGCPRQFCVMWQNIRCSILFHLLVPGGKWQTRTHDGSIEITTRLDPRTGSTHRLFDPLDWIHAVTAHIPERGRHCVRYYGALANRAQSPKAFTEQQTPPAPDPGASGETTSEFVQRRRASWARLIKRIFEVDPLLCSCGAEMEIISFITDPR